MDQPTWHVTYRIYRQQGEEPAHYDTYRLEVDPNEYVLDGVERVWAFHDRSLTFRHACHHSACGACGMRVNGVEKLSCITRIRDITRDGGIIKVEPLRHFPLIGDLAVDMGALYARMDAIDFPQVASLAQALAPHERAGAEHDNESLRLVDCIECGLCVSACPIMATALTYAGPAALAAAEHGGLDGQPARWALADSQDGAWRCHNTFECTAVCPSAVDPAARIMQLRRQIVGQRIKGLLRPFGSSRSRRTHQDQGQGAAENLPRR